VRDLRIAVGDDLQPYSLPLRGAPTASTLALRLGVLRPGDELYMVSVVAAATAARTNPASSETPESPEPDMPAPPVVEVAVPRIGRPILHARKPLQPKRDTSLPPLGRPRRDAAPATTAVVPYTSSGGEGRGTLPEPHPSGFGATLLESAQGAARELFTSLAAGQSMNKGLEQAVAQIANVVRNNADSGEQPGAREQLGSPEMRSAASMKRISQMEASARKVPVVGSPTHARHAPAGGNLHASNLLEKLSGVVANASHGGKKEPIIKGLDAFSGVVENLVSEWHRAERNKAHSRKSSAQARGPFRMLFFACFATLRLAPGRCHSSSLCNKA